MDKGVRNARGELSDGHDCFWTKLLVAYLVFYVGAVAALSIAVMGQAPEERVFGVHQSDGPE
jgi:hypothetical protein